jgi:hypothetical protein
MSLVIIQSPALSASQKKRIGDRIIESLHSEGIPASSVVILFQPDRSDIYLDGGLVHELTVAPAADPAPLREAAPRFVPAPQVSAEDYKTKVRRTRQELGELRGRLVALLEGQGGLSSFKAQDELGLKDCDWAPATLRRLFGELEEEGLIVKQGQKRGTRYVWKGRVQSQMAQAHPKLVKREAEGEAAEADQAGE